MKTTSSTPSTLLKSAGILLLPLLAVTLSGCSDAAGTSPAIKGEVPANQNSVEQEETVADETPAPQAPGEATGTDVGDNDGFTVPASDYTETDARGTFAHFPFPDKEDGAEYASLDAQKYLDDPRFMDIGITNDYFNEALMLSAKWLYRVSLDNVMADVPLEEAYKSPLWAERERVFNDYQYSALSKESDLHEDDSQFIMLGLGKDGSGVLPPLVRDGLPRIATTTGIPLVELKYAEPLWNAYNQPSIAFTYNLNVNYRVEDAEAISWGAHLEGISEEEFLETKAKEQLKDGTGVNYINLSGEFMLQMSKPHPDVEWNFSAMTTQLRLSADEFATD